MPAIPTSPLLKRQRYEDANIKTYTSITSSSTDSISSKSTHALPSGTLSIFGTYQNFLNALIGAGILGIPSVYATCGVFGGMLLMIIFAIISTYTMNLLIKTAQIYQVTEYEELGSVTFGAIGYTFTSLFLFLLDFGACTNYLIILGDASLKVIEIFGYDTLFDRQCIIIVISLIIIFPPCLWRDISFYQNFSTLKIVSVFVVISVVFYQWVMYRVIMMHKDEGYTHKYTPSEAETVWFDIGGIPNAIGIVAYAFVAHDSAFLCYNTLRNPTTIRWNKTIILSIVSAMIICLILSIPAYLTFGGDVDGNVLNNYEVKEISMIVTRVIYVIMMALTFPTAFFVVRHVAYAAFCRFLSLIQVERYKRRGKRENFINGEMLIEDDIASYSMLLFESEYNVKNSPLWQHVLCTCILFSISLTLSLFIVDLGTTMNLIGCLSSMNLGFVLPCITHIKATKYGFCSWITEKTFKRKWDAWLAIYPPLVLAIMGLFISVYGVMIATV